MRITETYAYRRAVFDTQDALIAALKRHRKGRTWVEMAVLTYISKDQLRLIRKGDRGTSMTTILDLAAALRVSPALFFPRGTK